MSFPYSSLISLDGGAAEKSYLVLSGPEDIKLYFCSNEIYPAHKRLNANIYIWHFNSYQHDKYNIHKKFSLLKPAENEIYPAHKR